MTCAEPPDVPGASTLVCAAALHSLVDQLGTAAASVFVERFIRLWPVRRQRLHLAVEQCDAEAGRDAALSLVSSATMAGAHRLAELGSQLHSGVPPSTALPAWTEAADLLNEIDRLGEASVADVSRLARDICPGNRDAEGATPRPAPTA
ncbi:Hpt domain-containing protein [Micrococcaceae bacterium RIT802]|nr:Hpt domain-containing protein [Micrococcaceae bacterium RIT 802]